MDIRSKFLDAKAERTNCAIEDYKNGKYGLSKALNYLKSEIRKLIEEDGLSVVEQIEIVESVLGTEINYNTYMSWYRRNLKPYLEGENFKKEKRNPSQVKKVVETKAPLVQQPGSKTNEKEQPSKLTSNDTKTFDGYVVGKVYPDPDNPEKYFKFNDAGVKIPCLLNGVSHDPHARRAKEMMKKVEE